MVDAVTQQPAAAGTTLPELVAQQMVILRTIAENGGELPPDLEKALETVDFAVAVKIDSYVAIAERLEHEGQFYKQKAAQFSKLRGGCESAVDRIWTALKQTMIKLELTEKVGVERRLVLSALEPKLVVDQTRLPKAYLKQVITWEPDLERIKEDIQMQVDVPGCTYEKNYRLADYAVPPPKPAKVAKPKKEAVNG